MSFVPLVTAWHRSRRERSYMPIGERSARMEKELGGNMSPRRRMEWSLIPFRREVERDEERER